MRISDWSSDVCSSDLEEASINAHGSSSSAGDEVDAAWRDRIDDAVAVLTTLREHDEELARAGEAAMWQSMIEAAPARQDEVRGGGAAPARTEEWTRGASRRNSERTTRKAGAKRREESWITYPPRRT